MSGRYQSRTRETSEPGVMATSSATKAPSRKLSSWMPILEWLPQYQTSALRTDFVAGITVWALVVPKAMAVAVIAGMPPEVGLYALPLALLGYAVFGTSRHLSVGPSTTVAIISFAVVYALANPGTERFVALTITLALLSGLMMIVAGFLRLGVIADFLSKPVLVGFIIGIAISIIFGQADKILGFEVEPPDFIPEILELVANASQTHAMTLIVGLASLGLLFAIDKFTPKLPSTITVVALSIVASVLIDLDSLGVTTVGDIPAGLPPIGQSLNITLQDLFALVPGALMLALIAFVVSIAVTNPFAVKHHYEVKANQEMIALGMANIGTGFSHGFAVEGSGSATATADVAGAKTQMTSIIAALLTVLTLVALTPLFRALPQATLAAVVIHAVWHQINLPMMRRYHHVRRIDFYAAMTALVGVLILGILAGLLLAVILSLVALLVEAKLARYAVLGKLPEDGGYHSLENYPGAETYPGLIIFRFDESLFFANSSSFRDGIRAAVAADPTVRWVLVDAEGINNIDITGMDMLTELNEELARSGVSLGFAQMKAHVLELFRRSGLEETVGPAHFFRSIQTGVDAIVGK